MDVSNINDNKNMTNILRLLSGSSESELLYRVGGLVKIFPYSQLVDTDNNNILLISNLLRYFVDNKYFIQNIQSVEKVYAFAIHSIDSIIKRGQKNTEEILLLMEIILQIITQIGDIFINVQMIFDLINAIKDTKYAKKDGVGKMLSSIFIEVMKLENIILKDSSSFIECATGLLIMIEDDLLNTIKVINTIQKVHGNSGIPEVTSIYMIAENSIKYLNTTSNKVIILNFLEAVSSMILRPINETSMNRIICEMLKKFKEICMWIRYPPYLGYIEIIIPKLVNYVFNTTMWPVDDLIQEIRTLSKVGRWENYKSDLVFVFDYITFLHQKIISRNEKYVHFICRRLKRSIPTNLAVLKSIGLLFCIYGRNTMFKEYAIVGHNLMRSLQSHEHLPLLLTYHPAQLISTLVMGSKSFKIRVLQMWIENNEDDSTLLKCIKICKSEQLLIQMFKNADDDASQKRIGSLIISFEDRSLVNCLSLMIPQSLLRPNLIGSVLEMHPDVPIDVEICAHYAKHISHVGLNIADTDAVNGLCKFSSRILDVHKDSIDILMCYARVKFIRRLLELSACSNDDLAIASMKLLRKLHLLHSKHHISTTDPIDVDLHEVFIGPMRRINEGSMLVYTIQRCNKNNLLSLTELRELYYSLLDIRNTPCGFNIYKILINLIRCDGTLLSSMMAVLCIKHELKKRTNTDPKFLDFLRVWLQRVNHNIIDVPTRDIRNYLTGNRNETAVLQIAELLNKCQLETKPKLGY